jgi:small GTP-binding protein
MIDLPKKSIHRSADAAMIVYDVNKDSTFHEIDSWMKNLSDNNENIVKMIVGNKIDLDRNVSEEQGKKKAKVYGACYTETSAKDNMGIDEAFENLVRLVI